MERSPAPAPGPSTLSPDGQFFWDGRQWMPTVTGDGRWHWNGAGWEPMAAIDPGNPQALAQTLLIQAEETYARAGALLAARRGEWTVDPAAQGLLARADQLAGAVQVDNAQLTTMNQQNVINRALATNDRKRIETDLGQAAAALRAVIVQIGRGAPSTTFPDGDLLLLAARNTEAQAAAINEALAAQQQAEAAYVARLTAAQQQLQQAESARGSALARAGDSVARATEAARAAGASAAGRRADEQAAQALLDTVTADRAASGAAESERKGVEADPELLHRIESAKTAVAAALANTAEVEAARGRPSALVAAAVTPPAPLGAGTGV